MTITIEPKEIAELVALLPKISANANLRMDIEIPHELTAQEFADGVAKGLREAISRCRDSLIRAEVLSDNSKANG